MRYSIRFKLVIAMTGLVVFFVFLSWFCNDQLLERYYFINKQNTLKTAYQRINNLYRDNSDQTTLELERLENDKALHITIFGSDYQIKYDSLEKEGPPSPRFMERMRQRHRISMEFLMLQAAELRKGQTMIRVIRDPRLNASFIFLAARLERGDYIVIRTPIAAIKESVAIANRFFLFIGFLTILLGGFLALLIAGRFTKPLLDLKQIAQKMALLDFSQKYQTEAGPADELGELGQSINSLSEQLEASISELQAANKKLREDIERERQIDEMRKEFVSNVSHELKTPISLIQGYAEGLKVNINEDEANKDYYCDVIMDEAAKMDRMVKQFLDLAQIESGSLPLERVDFDLGELLHRALKKNALLAGDGLRLEMDIPEGLLVKADLDLIEQVINNYLSNALNHLDGRKLLRVSAEHIGAKIRVTVFNSGQPIPAASLERIWTSFYKVDKSRTREYGGTGLGLSIVRAIQEAHGNAFGVENLPDGVAFWFEVDPV